MGSLDTYEAADDEKPQHTVYLDAYWIDQTEVTNAQYLKCVEAKVCPPIFDNSSGEPYRYEPPDHPMPTNWEMAQAYALWVGGRLPTEGEWEKACRGTDGRVYPWGDAFDGTRLNICDINCGTPAGKASGVDDGYAETAPVGSYPEGASPYGALDMAGNLEEWVADRYDYQYYLKTPYANPQGPDPGSGSLRVIRGGSYLSAQVSYASHYYFQDIRCADRDVDEGYWLGTHRGFRVLMEPAADQP